MYIVASGLTRRRQLGQVPNVERSYGSAPPDQAVLEKPMSTKLCTAVTELTLAVNVWPSAGWLVTAASPGGSMAGHTLGPKRTKLASPMPNSHIGVDRRSAACSQLAL